MTIAKEQLKIQCADFMKKNNLKIHIKNNYSHYGNCELESQDVYLVPITFHELRDDYTEQGIFIGRY